MQWFQTQLFRCVCRQEFTILKFENGLQAAISRFSLLKVSVTHCKRLHHIKLTSNFPTKTPPPWIKCLYVFACLWTVPSVQVNNLVCQSFIIITNSNLIFIKSARDFRWWWFFTLYNYEVLGIAKNFCQVHSHSLRKIVWKFCSVQVQCYTFFFRGKTQVYLCLIYWAKTEKRL